MFVYLFDFGAVGFLTGSSDTRTQAPEMPSFFLGEPGLSDFLAIHACQVFSCKKSALFPLRCRKRLGSSISRQFFYEVNVFCGGSINYDKLLAQNRSRLPVFLKPLRSSFG